MATWTKPENESPKPEFAPLNDLRIRLILIPIFGVAIPHLTGYFGPLTWDDPKYWAGLAWGIAISFVIWHGNRFFLIKQRQHYDWFQHPLRKLIVLAFACVFYTAPCVVLMMLAWFRFAGFGPDWDVIRIVTLACIICVAFITHVYETVYLIRQREDDRLARTEAELDALRAQVAPHFLFNSLNTLSWLIENNQERALDFNQNLAEVYRYILVARRRALVPLDEEWRFLQQYCALLKLRFEDGLLLEFETPGAEQRRWYIPPVSIQVLMENAVKHNEHSPRYPLRVRISFEEGALAVSNEKRPRTVEERSSRTGLRVLDERCRLAIGRGLEVEDGPDVFTVRIPAVTS